MAAGGSRHSEVCSTEYGERALGEQAVTREADSEASSESEKREKPRRDASAQQRYQQQKRRYRIGVLLEGVKNCIPELRDKVKTRSELLRETVKYIKHLQSLRERVAECSSVWRCGVTMKVEGNAAHDANNVSDSVCYPHAGR